MENNLDKTNFEITKKLEQIEREKYTKRHNNLNYVDFGNPNADKLSSASTTSMKQETLEEGAKRYYKDNIDESNIPREHYEWEIQDLMIGFANQWQQERSYSEEDMLNFAWFLIKNVGQYSDDRMAHFEGKYLEQFKKK